MKSGSDYLKGMTDPSLSPRLAPGLHDLHEALRLAESMSWDAAIAALRGREHRLALATARGVLYKLVAAGWVWRSGESDRRYDRGAKAVVGRDDRRVMLGDWGKGS